MSDRPFDAAHVNWVTVFAADFVFEPFCTEFKPVEPGTLVVVCGDNETRHRGVEVDFHPDGQVAVWVPIGGRVFWLPNWGAGDSPDEPWESRLREFDPLSNTWVTS
jgi:hypothetical protein